MCCSLILVSKISTFWCINSTTCSWLNSESFLWVSSSHFYQLLYIFLVIYCLLDMFFSSLSSERYLWNSIFISDFPIITGSSMFGITNVTDSTKPSIDSGNSKSWLQQYFHKFWFQHQAYETFNQYCKGKS